METRKLFTMEYWEKYIANRHGKPLYLVTGFIMLLIALDGMLSRDFVQVSIILGVIWVDYVLFHYLGGKNEE